MSANTQQILKDALTLPFKDRATLVDDILASIDQPDERIDHLWRKEVEGRVDAYRAGKMKAISLDEVLSKYQK